MLQKKNQEKRFDFCNKLFFLAKIKSSSINDSNCCCSCSSSDILYQKLQFQTLQNPEKHFIIKFFFFFLILYRSLQINAVLVEAEGKQNQLKSSVEKLQCELHFKVGLNKFR